MSYIILIIWMSYIVYLDVLYRLFARQDLIARNISNLLENLNHFDIKWIKNRISTLNFHFASDFPVQTSIADQTINLQKKHTTTMKSNSN